MKRILFVLLILVLLVAALSGVAMAAITGSFPVYLYPQNPDEEAPLLVNGVETVEMPWATVMQDYSVTISAGGGKSAVIYDIYTGYGDYVDGWTFSNGVLTIVGHDLFEGLTNGYLIVEAGPAVAVTIHANGGTARKSNYTYPAHYESITEDSYTRYFAPGELTLASSDTLLSRKGYNLVGYNTEPDGSGTAYNTIFTPYTELENGTELYAIWAPVVDEENSIFVGGKELFSGFYLDTNGTITSTQPEDGYAYYRYDSTTGSATLVLNDYSYTGPGYLFDDGEYDYEDFWGIIFSYDMDLDLTIELYGNNTLFCEDGRYGLALGADTAIITGPGSLTVSGASDPDGDPADAGILVSCRKNSAIVDTTIIVDYAYRGIVGIDLIEGSDVTVTNCEYGFQYEAIILDEFNFGVYGTTDLTIKDSTVSISDCWTGIYCTTTEMSLEPTLMVGNLILEDSVIDIEADEYCIQAVNMTVSGGTVTAALSENAEMYYNPLAAIYVSELTVNGGEVVADGSACSGGAAGIMADLYVSDGKVTGRGAYGIYGKKLTVTGGEVIGEGVSYLYEYEGYPLYYAGMGIILGNQMYLGGYADISGGTVTATTDYYNYMPAPTEFTYAAQTFYILGTLDVSGGTVNSHNLSAVDADISGGTLNIEGIFAAGGSFAYDSSFTFDLGELTISGGEFNFEETTFGSGITSATEANISGGVINISGTTVGGGIYAPELSITGGEITINNPNRDDGVLVITTGIAGSHVSVTGGTIEITNGTISAWIYEYGSEDDDASFVVGANPGTLTVGDAVELVVSGQVIKEGTYTGPVTSGYPYNIVFDYIGILDEEGNVPEHVIIRGPNTFTVTFDGTKVSFDGAGSAVEFDDYTATLSANRGYKLPASITVTVNGTKISEYDWDQKTGALTIPADQVTGNIVITAKGKSTGSGGGGGGGSSSGDSSGTSPVQIIGLNLADHYAYLVGVGNNRVNPLGNITRAEAATIFFRLMTDDFRSRYLCNSCNYTDVPETAWYNVAVSTLENAGLIKDTAGGRFRPNDPITRAEMAVLAAQFAAAVGYVPDADFSDVPTNHWAAQEIALVKYAGWVEGYKGAFRPEDNLSRAEFVTIVNRMLERGAEAENMLKDMVTFTDNANPDAWYYEAIQEAANSHTYIRTTDMLTGENFCGETWLDLFPTPDWTALEAGT